MCTFMPLFQIYNMGLILYCSTNCRKQFLHMTTTPPLISELQTTWLGWHKSCADLEVSQMCHKAPLRYSRHDGLRMPQKEWGDGELCRPKLLRIAPWVTLWSSYKYSIATVPNLLRDLSMFSSKSCLPQLLKCHTSAKPRLHFVYSEKMNRFSNSSYYELRFIRLW